ncbi:MAG TPA: DUF2127 domain-containing protein [Thermoanaerobaculia bacterium]|nr:DUF2127 domain-containing protein [Thermoanaerobaculia bacterium]
MESAHNDSGRTQPAKRLTGFFVAIIAFKFLKAAAFLIVGIVVLRFVHVTGHGAPMKFVRFLNVHPDRESIRRLSMFFDHITTGQREAIGAAALAICAVFAVEGFLLLGRIWWATYFTICTTLLGIPIELLEIWKRPRLVRGWVYLVINIAILAYLWYRRNEFRSEFRAERIIASPRGEAR